MTCSKPPKVVRWVSKLAENKIEPEPFAEISPQRFYCRLIFIKIALAILCVGVIAGMLPWGILQVICGTRDEGFPANLGPSRVQIDECNLGMMNDVMGLSSFLIAGPVFVFLPLYSCGNVSTDAAVGIAFAQCILHVHNSIWSYFSDYHYSQTDEPTPKLGAKSQDMAWWNKMRVCNVIDKVLAGSAVICNFWLMVYQVFASPRYIWYVHHWLAYGLIMALEVKFSSGEYYQKYAETKSPDDLWWAMFLHVWWHVGAMVWNQVQVYTLMTNGLILPELSLL